MKKKTKITFLFTFTFLHFILILYIYSKLNMVVILCMWGILAKTSKIQDHSPSMTLFKVALQNDLSPSKMLRYLATLLIMAIQWPTPVPFTSKDKVAYQINGKTTMSKEKKRKKKDIWVGRLLLVTFSISNKHPCYFQNKHLHFQKHIKNIENIFKRSTSLYTFLRTRIITKIA